MYFVHDKTSTYPIAYLQEKFSHLHRKEDEVQAILLNGEDMLARCREQDAVQLREDLKKLRIRMKDTRGKAEKRKVSKRNNIRPTKVTQSPLN